MCRNLQRTLPKEAKLPRWSHRLDSDRTRQTSVPYRPTLPSLSRCHSRPRNARWKAKTVQTAPDQPTRRPTTVPPDRAATVWDTSDRPTPSPPTQRDSNVHSRCSASGKSPASHPNPTPNQSGRCCYTPQKEPPQPRCSIPRA